MTCLSRDKCLLHQAEISRIRGLVPPRTEDLYARSFNPHQPPLSLAATSEDISDMMDSLDLDRMLTDLREGTSEYKA